MNLETPNQETLEQTGNTAVLLLDMIYPHPDNPWDVKPDDEDMSVLKASIEETGLQNPILVRPRPEGGYEMLSGHRRLEAFRQLGLCEIPAVILDCGKEEGIAILLNSNKYRTHCSLREQCRATALEYNQYKHQGQPSDPGDQAELHSRETIAKRMGKSPATISRMIRLSKLAAPFFGMIEKRKLTRQAANHLAVLDAASQQELLLHRQSRDLYRDVFICAAGFPRRSHILAADRPSGYRIQHRRLGTVGFQRLLAGSDRFIAAYFFADDLDVKATIFRLFFHGITS